jgi:hypothetical protein
MTYTQKRSRCAGCHDEVYHQGCGGSDQCWSFKTMKMVWKKEVHIDQIPPWTQKAKRVPSCYHRPQYVYLSPNVTR